MTPFRCPACHGNLWIFPVEGTRNYRTVSCMMCDRGWDEVLNGGRWRRETPRVELSEQGSRLPGAKHQAVKAEP